MKLLINTFRRTFPLVRRFQILGITMVSCILLSVSINANINYPTQHIAPPELISMGGHGGGGGGHGAHGGAYRANLYQNKLA